MPTLFPPEYPDRPDAPLLSFGPSFSEEIARSVIAAVWFENPDQPHEAEVRVAAALTMLEAFHPRDHLECMLAAQGVAAHSMIMECYRRAMHPDTPEAVAIKLRGNIAQLSRTFSTLVRDLERLQSKPLPDRPPIPPALSAPPPSPNPSPSPTLSSGGSPPPPMANSLTSPESASLSAKGAELPFETTAPPRRKRAGRQPKAEDASAGSPGLAIPLTMRDDPGSANANEAAETAALVAALEAVPEQPEDIETRPDGSPGSLAAYAPLPPPPEIFVPREPPIMVALATRPKPWRMVNGPPQTPESEAEKALPEDPELPRATGRGPLDAKEAIFGGDALARFASARFDPDTPIEPPNFDDEYSEVDLEMISTGGDPEAEAERQAMMAAHPEGKPIRTIRYGNRKPPDDQ